MSVTLSGTITDADTGLPIVGATVEVWDSGGSGMIDTTTTDGSGAYTFSLSAGMVFLEVSATGYTGGEATGIVLVAAPVVSDVALSLISVPTATYSIGDVALAGVGRAPTWQRPAFVSRIPLLDDGTGAVNETLQSGSLPARSATWDLPWVEDADLATLQGYLDGVTQVSVVTPVETVNAVVLELPPADFIGAGLWSISGVVLVEVPT
jgi:hypothetical protein